MVLVVGNVVLSGLGSIIIYRTWTSVYKFYNFIIIIVKNHRTTETIPGRIRTSTPLYRVTSQGRGLGISAILQ